MVDQSDLVKVTQLNDERNAIMRALDMFHENGRVTNLIVGQPILDEEGEPVGGFLFSPTIDVSTMEYPPQMRDAIMDYMGNRCIEIANELNSMGLTGVEEPKPRSPEPTPAASTKSKTKRRAA